MPILPYFFITCMLISVQVQLGFLLFYTTRGPQVLTVTLEPYPSDWDVRESHVGILSFTLKSKPLSKTSHTFTLLLLFDLEKYSFIKKKRVGGILDYLYLSSRGQMFGNKRPAGLHWSIFYYIYSFLYKPRKMHTAYFYQYTMYRILK